MSSAFTKKNILGSKGRAPAVRINPGWALPEKATTPEHIYEGRRAFIRKIIAGSLVGGIAGTAGTALLQASKAWAAETDVFSKFYPVARNEKYTITRPMTDEALALTYNNFYEFGSHKNIHKAAQKLVTHPWTVKITGAVQQERALDIERLLKEMPLEERVLRHRCVEAWAMTVPWSGFPLKALVNYVNPLSSAKYVTFETLADPNSMPGLKQAWYPWPYLEAITIEEAMNDLAFIATGLYGKPIAKQNGAPLRLVLPWKYGFKSAKSIVRIGFATKKPISFWEKVQPNEYGFWANVNPDVPHPRWSQAEERLLGEKEKVKTRLYNGYGEFVASLYSGLDQNKRLLFY